MEKITNLEVVSNMVLPKNTNIKTINGISLIATKYDTNINISGGGSTNSNVLIDGGGFTLPSNSVLIDAGSF